LVDPIMATLIVRLRGEFPTDEVAATGDDTGVLARIVGNLDPARFPYLAYVDPFGLTVFIRPQMEMVIPELMRLRAGKVLSGLRASSTVSSDLRPNAGVGFTCIWSSKVISGSVL
jgi:hypothetical protein